MMIDLFAEKTIKDPITVSDSDLGNGDCNPGDVSSHTASMPVFSTLSELEINVAGVADAKRYAF